jgi:hypothetical protein
VSTDASAAIIINVVNMVLSEISLIKIIISHAAVAADLRAKRKFLISAAVRLEK